MTTDRQPDERTSEASIRRLRDSLARLRVRARSLLLTRRLAWGLATILGVALAFALIDYVLRFPSAVRTIALLAGLVALVVWFRRAIIPAARFAPSLQDMALRVERLMPEYAGVLASAIDFTSEGTSTRRPRRSARSASGRSTTPARSRTAWAGSARGSCSARDRLQVGASSRSSRWR